MSEPRPIVGEGEDGARRTANLYFEELDTLDYADPRYDEVMSRAHSWEDRAYELMLERVGERPTLAVLRDAIGSEEHLTALALLSLSPTVSADAARFTSWSKSDGTYERELSGTETKNVFNPSPCMDWDAWADNVDSVGRGWSSTERRLFDLVSALTVPKRQVSLVATLPLLGSWQNEALAILVNWATGGNNRDTSGRCVVVARSTDVRVGRSMAAEIVARLPTPPEMRASCPRRR